MCAAGRWLGWLGRCDEGRGGLEGGGVARQFLSCAWMVCVCVSVMFEVSARICLAGKVDEDLHHCLEKMAMCVVLLENKRVELTPDLATLPRIGDTTTETHEREWRPFTSCLFCTSEKT